MDTVIDAGFVVPMASPSPLLSTKQLFLNMEDLFSKPEVCKGVANYPNLQKQLSKYLDFLGDIDPSTIIVTYGATNALHLALLHLFNEKKRPLKVATFSPYFPMFQTQVLSLNSQFIPIPLNSAGEIDEATVINLQAANPDVLILNDPHNPTGRKYSNGELKMIANHLGGVKVIADATYCWHFKGSSFIHNIKPDVYTAISFGKYALSCPNLRVGVLLCPSTTEAESIKRLAFNTQGNVSNALMEVISVVTDMSLFDVEHYKLWRNQLKELWKQRSFLLDKLAKLYPKIHIFNNSILCFVWVWLTDFPSISANDREIASFLQEKNNIIIVPGSAFGVDPNQCCFRVSLELPFEAIEYVFASLESLYSNLIN